MITHTLIDRFFSSPSKWRSLSNEICREKSTEKVSASDHENNVVADQVEEAIENQDDQDVEAERSEDETDYEDEDIVFNHLQNAADQHEPTIELQNSYYHSF